MFRDPGLQPLFRSCGHPGSSEPSCDDCLYNLLCCRPVIRSRPCDGFGKCKLSKRGCILLSDSTNVVLFLIALFFAIYSAGDGSAGTSEPWMEISSSQNSSFKAIERHYISAPISVAICRLDTKTGWSCSRGQSSDAMAAIGRKSFDSFEYLGLEQTRLALAIGNGCSIFAIAVILVWAFPLARTNNDPRKGSRCINGMPNTAFWATRTRYLLFIVSIAVVASYFFARRNYETYVIAEAKMVVRESTTSFPIEVSDGFGFELIITSIVLAAISLLFSCCSCFAGQGWHFKNFSGSLEADSVHEVPVNNVADDDGLQEALEAVERSIAEERARERRLRDNSQEDGIELSVNPIQNAELRLLSIQLARQRMQVEQREQELLRQIRLQNTTPTTTKQKEVMEDPSS